MYIVSGGWKRSRELPRSWSRGDEKKRNCVLLRRQNVWSTNVTCPLLPSRNVSAKRRRKDRRWNAERSAV